jgi:hypothetical protein
MTIIHALVASVLATLLPVGFTPPVAPKPTGTHPPNGTSIATSPSVDSSFPKLTTSLAKRGWGSGNSQLAAAFHDDYSSIAAKERHSNVARFVASSIERHYWVAAFLSQETYLGSASKESEFAMLLLVQATAASARTEIERFTQVAAGVCLSVLAEQAGLRELAISAKAQVNRRVAQDDSLQGAYPALSPQEHEIYDRIPVPSQ